MLPLILFLVFVILPIAELYVIIQVGGAIGILPTLALLLADGFLGAYLTRTQGRTAWRRFNQAIAEGRVPAKETYDGAAIVFGGALLLSPGFITDVLGILLLFPPTRAIMRRLLLASAVFFRPARYALLFYNRVPQGRRSAPSGAGAGAGGRTPGAGAPPPPPRPTSPRRDYDVEGTAREIPDDDPALGSGGTRG